MLNIPLEVKQLLLADGTQKNIMISFPNGERRNITNQNIVQNSVKFTESFCSRDNIKFGLIESSKFECETVGIENIIGCRIKIELDINVSSLSAEWISQYATRSGYLPYPYYPIDYGLMYVAECKKQTDMTHRKIVAYSYDVVGNLSMLSQYEINDKLEYEGENKETVEFDALFLSATNFPDMFMHNIFDYSELHCSVGSMDDYEVVVDGFKYQWRFEGYDSGFYGTNTRTSHDLLYVPTPPKNVTREDLADFYNIIPDVIKSRISRSNFLYASDISLLSRTSNMTYNKAYYGDGNYIYIQDAYVGSRATGRAVFVPTRFVYSITNVNYPEISESNSIEIRNANQIKMYHCTTNIEDFKFTLAKQFDNGGGVSIDLEDMRGIFEGYLELKGLFGKFERNGEFSLTSPRNLQGLYPDVTLYPSEMLFPSGTDGYSIPSLYSSGWYDDALTKPIGRVSTVFKRVVTVEEKEQEESVYGYIDIVDGYNENEYTEYSLKENYFFKTLNYEWPEVSQYLQTVAEKIADIRYMPCDIDGIGQPWLEAGDTIAFETLEGDIVKTIILSRTLTGEQYLVDSLESK